MVAPDDVRQKLEAGRAVAVQRLRLLADRLDGLRLEDVGEVLAWIAPALDRLEAESAAAMLKRAPRLRVGVRAA